MEMIRPPPHLFNQHGQSVKKSGQYFHCPSLASIDFAPVNGENLMSHGRWSTPHSMLVLNADS